MNINKNTQPSSIEIRKATDADYSRIMEIYAAARAFMRENGNMTQWVNGYPYPEIVSKDICGGNLYVVCSEGKTTAVFGIFEGEDPTYTEIHGGNWASDAPYAAIHRVASDGSFRGVMRLITEFADRKYDHLRIDTHEDNIPMQKALASCGFVYRGIIHLADGAPRMAYDRLAD